MPDRNSDRDDDRQWKTGDGDRQWNAGDGGWGASATAEEDDPPGSWGGPRGGTPSPTPSSIVSTVGIALALVVVGFGLGVGVAMVMFQLLLLAGVDVIENVILQTVVQLIALQGIGFGVAALGYVRYRGLSLREAIAYLRVRTPSLRDVAWMIGGVVGMLAALVGLNTAVQQLGLEASEHGFTDLAVESPELLLVLIPFSYLLVGPGEELLFRGIIQTAFVDHLGTAGGIVAASALFSLIHLPAYWGEGVEVSLALLTVVGLIVGYTYERTDNLVVPIVIHATYNAIQFLALYVLLTNGVDGSVASALVV